MEIKPNKTKIKILSVVLGVLVIIFGFVFFSYRPQNSRHIGGESVKAPLPEESPSPVKNTSTPGHLPSVVPSVSITPSPTPSFSPSPSPVPSHSPSPSPSPSPIPSSSPSF